MDFRTALLAAADHIMSDDDNSVSILVSNASVKEFSAGMSPDARVLVKLMGVADPKQISKAAKLAGQELNAARATNGSRIMLGASMIANALSNCPEGLLDVVERGLCEVVKKLSLDVRRAEKLYEEDATGGKH